MYDDFELTRTLNNGCYYLTIKEDGKLWLNSCLVQNIETVENKGKKYIRLTSERGWFDCDMHENFWRLENHGNSDIYVFAVKITR